MANSTKFSKSKLLYDWHSVSQYVSVPNPLWDLWPDITSWLKVAVLSLWGAPCDERTGLQFVVQSLRGLSRAEPITMLYCFIWDSPQPGGPGSHFYIPQEQGGPVLPLAIGFPLRRLLRFAGLWWRCSSPPPTWRARSPYIYIYIYIYPSGTEWSSSKSKSRYDLRAVTQHVLVPGPRGFRGVHPNEFQFDIRRGTYCEILYATIERAACEVCSATWNLGTNSAFGLGPRKTLVEFAGRRIDF
jgi:hypothetical protein